MLGVFTLLPETSDVLMLWLELVTNYQVHDTKLVAIAKAHKVENLLTLNVADFKRFDLKAVHPSEI
jgi:predicted nucleic acid-binding protein